MKKILREEELCILHADMARYSSSCSFNIENRTDSCNKQLAKYVIENARECLIYIHFCLFTPKDHRMGLVFCLISWKYWLEKATKHFSL